MDLTLPWKMVGHEKQLLQLEHDLASGNLAHAYLLAGPSQIGKFAIAKKLAMMLQCEHGFCRECSTCLHLEKGYHADTIEFADDGNSLKIEQIRGLLGRLATTTQSRYKVVLMQDIERMTAESMNALLKTLEDPPSQVIFLLTTSNLKALLPTLLSRVRMLKFKNLSEESLRLFLHQQYPHIAADEVNMTLVLALGKPGKALMLMEQPELFGHYRTLYDRLGELFQKTDRMEQFATIAELSNDDGSLENFLNVFMAMTRQDLLKLTTGNPVNADAILHRIRTVKMLEEIREMLGRNVNMKLALENLMLTL